MTTRISQREARRLRKQVQEQSRKIDSMEGDIRRWRNYNALPGGKEIFKLDSPSSSLQWAIYTAQNLNHTVIARFIDGNVRFSALPSPTEKV